MFNNRPLPMSPELEEVVKNLSLNGPFVIMRGELNKDCILGGMTNYEKAIFTLMLYFKNQAERLERKIKKISRKKGSWLYRIHKRRLIKRWLKSYLFQAEILEDNLSFSLRKRFSIKSKSHRDKFYIGRDYQVALENR